MSDDPGVRSRGKSLELLLMVDSLTVLVKKFKSSLSSASQPTPPNTATTASSTLPTTLSEVKEDPNSEYLHTQSEWGGGGFSHLPLRGGRMTVHTFHSTSTVT